jgi:hypothetical protein
MFNTLRMAYGRAVLFLIAPALVLVERSRNQAMRDLLNKLNGEGGDEKTG